MNNVPNSTIFRISALFRIAGMLAGLILLFGYLVHLIEPKTFPTFFEGVWWAIVTVFTIGYGDYAPESTIGKIFAIAFILIGTSLGSYYMITLATELISRQYANHRGETIVNLTNHLLIIGWNERTRLILAQYEKQYPGQGIVLVDETLPTLPSLYKRHYFVKGSPHHDDVLKRAGIHKAKMIMITANTEKNETDADVQSILTILTAKGLNPHIYCIAEMLTTSQLQNAKRAGADEVIETNKLTSYVFATSLTRPYASETILALYQQARIQFLEAKMYVGKNFKESIPTLLEQDFLLIGIQRGGENYIHPSDPFFIEADDRLITIEHSR